MSSKDKLQKDYDVFVQEIENMAQEALKKIHEKADAIKSEAVTKGKEVELIINGNEEKVAKEKG